MGIEAEPLDRRYRAEPGNEKRENRTYTQIQKKPGFLQVLKALMQYFGKKPGFCLRE